MTRLTSVPSWAEPAILLSPSYQPLLGVGEDAQTLLSSIEFYKGAGYQGWCSCQYGGTFHSSNHIQYMSSQCI